MTSEAPEAAEATAAVRRRLRGVIDPELDESIVDLGFVTDIQTGPAGDVRVRWRVPTYWCALNFVHLMAADMRRALIDLPWLGRLELCLLDHMAAAEINARYSYDSACDHSDADPLPAELESLRRAFLIKAFQRRQERLLRRLGEMGNELSALLALDRLGLQALATDDVTVRILARYFESRERLFGCREGEPALVDAGGAILRPSEIRLYMRRLALINLNGEINSAVCRSVLARGGGITTGRGPCGH